MAQRSIILGFEPRLIGNFVAIFKVIKAIQFQCFFKQIQQLRFCIGFVNFKNLQKRKGIRLGPLFSNQISLVTLRFLFTISGQTKFLIPNPVYILPCTFLFIIFIMDHSLQSNKLLKMTIYIITYIHLNTLKGKTR